MLKYIPSDCLLVFLIAKDSMEKFSGIFVEFVHDEIVKGFAEVCVFIRFVANIEC